MDWKLLLEQVWAWIVAAQLPVIVGLIVVDVALGIAVAIKGKFFDWTQLGEFYRSMVVPYLLAYLVLRGVLQAIPEIAGVGEGVVSDGLAAAAFGVIVYNLIGSVVDNLRALELFKGGSRE